jgi:hypothetical protein
MTKTLGVCGGSYWTAVIEDEKIPDTIGAEGTHFTEILAKRLGYEYYTLARPGMSNYGIRLQVDEMIKKRVDFVIFGNATAGRIEVPFKKFNREYGIHNISYINYCSLSRNNVDNSKASIVSETLVNLSSYHDQKSDNRNAFIKPEQATTIKSYLLDLHDNEYKKQLDIWVLSSAIQALEDAKIPYLFMPNDDWVYQDQYFKLRDNNKRLVNDVRMRPCYYDEKHPSRVHHTSDESQMVLSRKTYGYIIENRLLDFNDQNNCT